jgi:hypothetical protein
VVIGLGADGQHHGVCWRALRLALLNARHSVYILGWDIDSRTVLVPGINDDGMPPQLGDLLHALAESFRLYPVEVGMSLPMGFDRLLRLAADMFGIALTIALPFLAVMLLTNVVLGVLARVAPQLNVFAVGFPLTILVGLATLFLLLPYIEVPLRAALERALGIWMN